MGEYAPCNCPRNPLGGIERVATIISKARKEEKNFLFVVSPNSLFPSLVLLRDFKSHAEIKARLIFNSLSHLRPLAVGVGRKDLTQGVNFVSLLRREFPLRLVSANLKDKKGNYIFDPFIIKKVGEYKIGITGLTGKTPSKGSFLYEKPQDCLGKVLSELRKRGCNFIVVLSDLRETEEREIISKFSEIDLIISSANEFPTKEPLKFGKSFLVRPYPKLRYVGKLKVSLSDETRSIELENIPVSREVQPDPVIQELVSETKSQLKTIESGVSKLFKRIPKGFVGKEVCIRCHKQQFDFWKKTRHSKAYLTLKEKNEEFNLDCIPCHATGLISQGFMENVQCEACHGGGEAHAIKGKPIKKKVEYEECIRCHEPQRFGSFDYDSKIGAVSCP